MRFLIPFLLLVLLACNSNKNQDAADTQSLSDSTAAESPAPFKYEFMDTILVSIYPKDFFQVIKLKPNVPILDLRTEEEFKAGHIWRAVNMDPNDPNFMARLAGFGRTQEYAVYCKQGPVSFAIAEEMKRMGFMRIYHLRTGLINWGETKQALQIGN